MDIATCAAAERHTKVNCVTVAMGDVVVEHSPRVGELLTLTAEPDIRVIIWTWDKGRCFIQ